MGGATGKQVSTRKKTPRRKQRATKARSTQTTRRDQAPRWEDPFATLAVDDDRYRRAFADATARFGARADVSGIDIGFRIRDGRQRPDVCIRIHVREKFDVSRLTKRELFPKTIRGVPIDVIQAVYERHDSFDPARQTAVEPVQPGVSIGALDGPTGTLGLILEDVVDNARVLLSAGHVFAPSEQASPGDPVLQPGRADGGVLQDTVGALHRLDEATDSAVAAAFGARVFSTQILGATYAVPGLRYPQLGDILEKSGRSTGMSQGRVDGIAPQFGALRFVFRIVPLEGDDEPLCDFGDSGAVWYDPATGEAVGLHVMGGDTPFRSNAYAIATSLIYATQRLGVRLPGSG
jgi:hypothetical protein